jgi:hypothetical protein
MFSSSEARDPKIVITSLLDPESEGITVFRIIEHYLSSGAALISEAFVAGY